MLPRALVLGLAVAGCAAPATSPPPAVTFVIASGFGEEGAWTGEHLRACAEVLVRLMDAPDVAPPSTIEVTLERDPEADYLGGGAGPTALAFVSDQWPMETQRLWIVTHELCNLFAAHYGGHGGFPSDWWSNGRSPFPAYLAGLVLDEVGRHDAADWLRSSSASEPDHVLYWELHERFGFGLFSRALGLLRHDDLDLGEIEPPWPHPDRVRSAYTIAYLSLSAGEDLTAIVLAHGIGRQPADWHEVHPEIPFVEYTVTSEEVAGILAAREALFGADADADGTAEEARALYRAGRWRQAQAARAAR